MFKNYKKAYLITKEIEKLKDQKIEQLEKELQEARNLKEILDRLSSIKFNGIDFLACGGSWDLNLPDYVLQYTDDILGGKVIKQEGTKCIVISKEGTVKEGLTKQKADKGYGYKLVRE